MSKFIGRLVDIGIAKETTRGTSEASATFWLPKMSLSYDDKIMQVIDESSVGVIEDATDAVVVGKFAEGEFEGKIGSNSMGLLFLGTLGTVSTTTTESTAYIHSFSVQEDAQSDSMTIFQDDPNQDYTYGLGMIDKLELMAELEKFATVKVGFRSFVGTTASLSPSYSSETNFLPQHASLTYASNLAGLGGGTVVPVRSLKLSISKNVEDDRKLGSVNPADILNKQMSCEGEIELVFDAETFKTQQLADTALAFRIKLANTDVTIGSTLNPQVVIDLARVKIKEFTRNYGNDDIVTATVSFKAFYSISDAQMIAVELTNTQSSY